MQTAATRERLAGYADAINREPVHPIEDWTPEDAEEALWAAMISGLMHERLCFPENVERYARSGQADEGSGEPMMTPEEAR